MYEIWHMISAKELCDFISDLNGDVDIRWVLEVLTMEYNVMIVGHIVLCVLIQLLLKWLEILFDVGANYYSPHVIDYLVANFGFIRSKLFRVQPKEEFYDTKIEHSSRVKPIYGSWIKLTCREKYICDPINICNSLLMD